MKGLREASRQEAKAALAVRDPNPADTAEDPRHETVRGAPQAGHRGGVAHPIPEDEVGGLGRLKKSGEVRGVVLAVGVHEDQVRERRPAKLR